MNHNNCPLCNSRLNKDGTKTTVEDYQPVKMQQKYKCSRWPECRYTKLSEENILDQGKAGAGIASDEDVKISSYEYDEKNNGVSLSGNISSKAGSRVKTLDSFLRLCEVDLDTWEVGRYALNAWDMTMSGNKSSTGEDSTYTNYQIKVWLKRKEAAISSLESFIQSLHDRRSKVPNIALRNISGNNMFEISMYDHHFGKLAWKPETGENYDLKIAKEMWMEGMAQHERQARIHKPKQIVLPVGNDFIHVNNIEGTTQKGTRQDTEGRLPKIYDTAFECIIWSIDILKKISPVHVVLVTSNHDETIIYFLLKTLWAYYINDKNVTFDISPKPRKRYLWGKNFIGYDHGEIKPERLPQLFIDEWPEDWAEATWREVHVGHLHKAKQMNFVTVDTIGSMVHRVLPSLTATDYWHYKSGFVNGLKCTDSFVWNKEDGMIDNFHIYL